MPLIIPEHYRRWRLLSADPGLTNTGLASFDIDYVSNQILSVEAFTLTNDKLLDTSELDDEFHPERTIKLLKLQNAFIEALGYFNPCEVACEAPFYNRFRPSAYGPLVEVVNTLYFGVLSYNPNIRFTTLPPMTVKKTVGAKAAKNDTVKGKDLVKAAIMQIPEIMDVLVNDIHTLSEHAIDSIAVGYSLFKSGSI